MPITEISFGRDDKDSPTPGGEDVHILRGQSTGELRARLWVQDPEEDESQTFDDFRAAHGTEVRVEFRPVFRATDAGTEFTGFGIRVNKETGEVSVADGTPPNFAPANFIVEAVVTRNVGGIAPAAISPAVLRVHVHGSVDRIRLTPDTLTIRDPTGDGRIDTRYAFTVRAWFDDGTVGDVTFSPELALWEPERFFRPSTPGRTRRITIPADALIPRRVPVTITTSMAWGVHSASGTIDLREPWEITPDLPRAEWIDGHPHVLDGTLKPERVANVLFLAGGCADTNRGAFVQLTGLLAHQLKVDPLLQPYGYLAGSMNFWRLALPGQPGGISVRGEVVPFTRDNRLFARLLDAPVRPPASGKWKLEHLLYMAGLPVPADLRLVREKATDQPLQSVDDVRALDADEIDFTRLEQKWSAMMRAAPARNVSHTVMRKWLRLAARTFIDEVDNFPALALGLPPSARFDESGSLAFHALRGGIAECRTFLTNVSAEPQRGRAAITLGTTWLTRGRGAQHRAGQSVGQRSFELRRVQQPPHVGHGVPRARGTRPGGGLDRAVLSPVSLRSRPLAATRRRRFSGDSRRPERHG